MTDQVLEPSNDDLVVDAPKDDKPEPELSETEKQAMESGWVPKEQWKGAEDDWVPAKAFLKYGQVESELKRTRSDASQKEKVIKTMKDYYLNVKEDAKKEILETFRRQKREAMKIEDFETVAKLDSQIDELTGNLERKFQQHDKNMEAFEQAAPNTPPPEFYEWNQRNSWYQLGGRDEMTQEADALAVAYERTHPGKSYQDMLNHVTAKMKQLHPDKFKTPSREKPVADVNEPGDLGGEPPGKKSSVKLSAAEKAAAEAFGLTYEEYAAGLKEWDNKKGFA